MIRCYLCDTGEARYLARLDYDCTPVVSLCEECAERERRPGWESVVWIRSMPRA